MEKKKKKDNIEGLLGNLLGGQILFENVEEVLERKIVGIGNGAHINIPKKHLGKTARVTIYKQEDTKKKK